VVTQNSSIVASQGDVGASERLDVYRHLCV